MSDLLNISEKLGRLAEAQENTDRNVNKMLSMLETYVPKTERHDLEIYGNEATQHVGLKTRMNRFQKVAAMLAAIFVPSGATAAAAYTNPEKASKALAVINHLLG